MANNIEKFLGVYAAQLQELETAILEVLVETRLANAVGVQLDVIGKIVGVERSSSTDDRYRALINAQIATNLASGTVPELLEIVGLVVGESVELTLKQYFPAAFEIEVDAQTLPVGQGAVVAGVVKDAKAGGVNGLFRWYEVAPVFRLDGAGGSQLDGGFFLGTSL